MQTYLPSLKTGAGMGFPVIMKCPFDYTEFMMQMEVTTDDEIAIGDIALVAAGLLDISTDESAIISVIVLDTTHNKAILEGHGLAVTKATQFKDGDKIDVVFLLRNMVVSMKCVTAQLLTIGSKVCASATAGAVKLNVTGTDPVDSVIGMAVTIQTSGTGTSYIGVLI